MKIVIYGANEVGCLIATKLFEDHDVTIIDDAQNKSDDCAKIDISFVYGNGSSIDTLKEAGIKEADIFIACTENQEANIVSCIMAKSIQNIKTVCYVNKEEYVHSLAFVRESPLHCRFAVDYIIWPEELLTQQIFRIITIPNAIYVENFADGKGRLLEYRIKKDSILLDKKLKECHFPPETLIVGITRDNKLFIPDGETIMTLNDKVVFMGSIQSLNILAGQFFSDGEKVKDVTIIGGGTVGLMLAQNLEKLNIKVKIIEKDYKRCEYLTEVLKKTLVINGDGTNLELLQMEDIDESEVVVCVTNNDEKNLLCALLAKQLNVSKVITRVTQESSANIFEKVGIDVAISLNAVAVEEIQTDLIQNDVEILATVEQGQGEVIEIEIPQKAAIRKIMDIHMPEKGIIAIIQRNNKIIIPKGDSYIMPGDNLIIFTREENSAKIKEFFSRN